MTLAVSAMSTRCRNHPDHPLCVRRRHQCDPHQGVWLSGVPSAAELLLLERRKPEDGIGRRRVPECRCRVLSMSDPPAERIAMPVSVEQCRDLAPMGATGQGSLLQRARANTRSISAPAATAIVCARDDGLRRDGRQVWARDHLSSQAVPYERPAHGTGDSHSCHGVGTQPLTGPPHDCCHPRSASSAGVAERSSVLRACH